MNRPGQPQQRPPNLTANPALTTQFRPPYPTYGLPPRSVLPAGAGYVPNPQPNSHRTATQQSQLPGLTPQPTLGFNQLRGQSSFSFGGALGQHQPSSVLQQQQSLPSQQQQQQQPQSNGAQSTMSSLLAQTPGQGATPAVSSSAGEVGLDLNDFPALGSTPANPNSSSSNNGSGAGTTASYATQAGTGVLLGGTSGTGNAIGGTTTGSQTRDFTSDDFPALGGQAQTNQQSRDPLQNQLSAQDNLAHPPGLNGFQPSEQQTLRQNILGGHSVGLQGTPGMLNLGPSQSRNIHPGFQQGQTDMEKQQQRSNYSLKLNQASHAAWSSSPNVNPISQSQQPGGVNGPNGAFSQNPPSHAPGAIANPTAPPTSGSTPYPPNSLNPGDSHANPSIPNPNGSSNPIPTPSNPTNPTAPSTSHLQHPQTPAQQVLISAADRWGLLSLIAMMRNANSEADHGLTSIGTDLGTMGLDMGFPGNLYSTFITPWADQSAARTVEPDFHLPACYLSVQAPPPGPAKAAMFSDETLFFMFYASPRDALQEVAAQELWNRNWRYHKDLRLWITKESGTSPSQKVQGGGGEQGQYTFWDSDNWCKERKEMTVLYSDLEEKSPPAFAPGPGLVLQPPQPQATSQQGGQMAAQSQLPTRGTFQMGMAGL